LDELLEIHFLDLTKLPKDNLTSLEKWLMFIKTDSKEVRTMLAQENPIMAKANQQPRREHKVVAVGFNTLRYDASVGVLNPPHE